MQKLLFTLIILFIFINANSQNPNFCKQLSNLKTIIDTTHYEPKPVNDFFSEAVFELFTKSLDKNNKFLTQEDINSLHIHKNKLDNYINDGECEFINDFVNVLQSKIIKTQSYLDKISNIDLDYSGKDTISFDNTYKAQANDSDLYKYWTKRIRYLTVNKIIETDSIFENIKSNFKQLEKDLKHKVIEKESCLINEIENQNGGIRQFVEETFLNAYLNYQDPNSTYFNSSGKNLFNTSIANNQLSFGITTTKNNDGNIVVSNVAVGSPAFKHGGIEINDIILSLKSQEKTLETYCISNNDILDFLNHDTNKSITFTIKKKSGNISIINLTKTIVEIEENSITGYIINGNKYTIGYIKAPGFYTDLESPYGLGMANDIAKEVYKLQKENIEALILDLRFNGGGSMKEAIDLSGMFINRGPLAIVKDNNQEDFVLKDFVRGSIYNKPLLILVNHFSASASELFAAAMQDYNRAIIVGTPTYGKASSQVIFPVGEDEKYGFAKLTTDKFYRVSGKSHQSQGIIPDIILPSIYDNLETSEKYYPYALSNDTVEVTLKPIKMKPIPLSALKNKSKERLEKNAGFLNIKRTNETLLKDYIKKNIRYSLTLNNIYKDIDKQKTLWSNFEAFQDTLSFGINVKNTKATTEILEYNYESKEKNTLQLKKLSKDLYINEAYYILTDLLNIYTKL